MIKLLPTCVTLGPGCYPDAINVTGRVDPPPRPAEPGLVWVCGWYPSDGTPLMVQIPQDRVPPVLARWRALATGADVDRRG